MRHNGAVFARHCGSHFIMRLAINFTSTRYASIAFRLSAFDGSRSFAAVQLNSSAVNTGGVFTGVDHHYDSSMMIAIFIRHVQGGRFTREFCRWSLTSSVNCDLIKRRIAQRLLINSAVCKFPMIVNPPFLSV